MKKIIFFVAVYSAVICCSHVANAQINIVNTIAGCGGCSTGTADGIAATAAHLGGAKGVCVDRLGNVYIASDGDAKIRKVNATSGLIYTVAGTGTSGFSGDGSPATGANMYNPCGICLDRAGNLYVADNSNGRIRKIDAGTNIISTVAGGGTSTLDGVAAVTANIGGPVCVYVDSVDNIFLANGGTLRKVDATSGLISTMPMATSMGFTINNITMDAAGNFYLSEYNGVVKLNTSGTAIMVAGGGSSFADSIPATNAELSNVTGCAVDASGNLFIADQGDNVIREVSAITGYIKTITGCGSLSISGIPALSADGSSDMITLDSSGNIYYSSDSNVVRKITENSSYFQQYNLSYYSFSINTLCSGPVITITTPYYTSGLSIKTYFGDGYSVSTPFNSYGCIAGPGFAVVSHNYTCSGNYTIKYVLYNGSTAVDSMHISYNYSLCNTIPVKFYLDANNNCIKDPTEAYTFKPVVTEVDSNGVAVDTISATSGFDYNAYGSAGCIYTFKVISTPVGYHFTCPATGILNDTLQTVVYNDQTSYFGFQCNDSAAFDLQVNAVVPVTGIHDEWGNIYVTNNYCEPVDATVSVTFSPKYVSSESGGGYDINPTASSTLGNTITWNLRSLAASASRPEDLYYAIWANPLTGFLTVGDSVHSHYLVTPTTGDVNPTNNVEVIIDTVRAGCDPNNMAVSPNECTPPGAGPFPLQYTISFVNTGNDTAFNIYIMDTLSKNVDVKSMNVVMTSATMFVSHLTDAANDQILKFDFPNINLLDSISYSQQCSGAVIFTINTLPGLANGTTVFNHAGIFFDNNPVVMTNTVENVIGCDLKVPTVANIGSVEIFPNPTTNILTIKTSQNGYNSIIITNTVGQVMTQQEINSTQTIVNVNSFAAGLYYITLKGDNGSKVEKFVKM